MFLKEQPDKYTLVDNHRIDHTKPSVWLELFALPATKNEDNGYMIIKSFATCQYSYTAYTYTYGSTKSLNWHKRSKRSSSVSNSPM